MATGARQLYYYPTVASRTLNVLLRESIRSERSDALLLSGGIDSSALAALDPTIPAYTANMLGSKTKNLDITFAGKVQKHLGITLHPVFFTAEEGLESLRPLMRLTESYDFALLNDLALYMTISRIVSDFGRGYLTVRSGEAADVLFRGYYGSDGLTFERQAGYIDSTDSSNLPLARIAPKIGVRLNYPYLDPRVKEFSKTLSAQDNVVYRNKPGGVWDTHPDNPFRKKRTVYPFGKITLRRAMFGYLPDEVALRIKTDIEFGSGTDSLRLNLKDSVGTKEYRKLQREGLDFWNRAHAGLYLLYKEEGLKPSSPKSDEFECVRCHGAVARVGAHCSTCGADPSNMTFAQWRDIVVLRRSTENQNQ